MFCGYISYSPLVSRLQRKRRSGHKHEITGSQEKREMHLTSKVRIIAEMSVLT